MNLFEAKLNVVLMSALVAGMLILVGQTAVQAMSVDSSIAPSAYLEHSNPAEVVPSMPNGAELRLSPSYYRDDVTKIEGAVAPVASELRFSLSYHQDDPTVIEATKPASIDVEQRWGPSYYQDDPALVYGD